MATLAEARSCPTVHNRSFWWCYETSVASHHDRTRIRERVRSRIRGQRGVRLTDLLLVIDVLLIDAFDSGFAQRDLHLTITANGSRVMLTLAAAETPAAIAPKLPKTAGQTLLDLVSLRWGVRQQRARKLTWVLLGGDSFVTPSEPPRDDSATSMPSQARSRPAVANYTRHAEAPRTHPQPAL